MKANQALGDTGFFAHGDTLFSTILLNTPNQSQEAWETDSIFWESPIQVEQMGVVRAPAGIADYLTYQARVFELFTNDAGNISGVTSWVGWKHEMGSQEELLPVSPYSIFVERNGEWKRETFIRDFHTHPAPTKKQARRMTWAPTVLTGTFALYAPDLDTRCMVAERVDTLPSHWERFLGYELASITTDGKKAIIHSVTEDSLAFPREKLVGDTIEAFMEVFASVRETHARLRFALSQVSPEAVQGEHFLRFTQALELSARLMFNSGGEEALTAWEQKVRRSASEVLEGELGRLPVSRVLEAQGVVRGFLKYCREGAVTVS